MYILRPLYGKITTREFYFYCRTNSEIIYFQAQTNILFIAIRLGYLYFRTLTITQDHLYSNWVSLSRVTIIESISI